MHQIKVNIGEAYNPPRRETRTQSGAYSAYRPTHGHLSDLHSSTEQERFWDRLVFVAAVGGGVLVLLLAVAGVIS
jgi:hypothetical protein